MDSGWELPCTIVLTLAAAYGVPKLLRFMFRKIDVRDLLFGDRQQRDEKPGVVYLHMFPRSVARQVVNLSPFAVKLETWLRLRKLPYEVVQTMSFSRSTRQIPYIRLDGEEVADSLFIVDFLIQKFQLDPLEGGTEEQQAVTRAFTRMADDGLALTYFWYRYYHFAVEFLRFFRVSEWRFISKRALRGMGRGVHIQAVARGLARHTPSDVGKIGQGDVVAISKFLADKPFMFGDQPRLLDCVVFGHLSQLVYVDLPYPHKEVIARCSNIEPYMERMKATLWPDWDTLVNMEPFS